MQATLCERPELSPHSFMRTRAQAAWLLEAESPEALVEALAAPPLAGLPRLILGEGSNVLFVGDFPGVVVRLRNKGVAWGEEEDGSVLLRAAAAERWDTLVQASVAHRLWGLENLAAIPGTVGAAPIQNIGAYGRELAETLVGVELLDLERGRRCFVAACDLGLGYRTSSLRQPAGQGRWLIAEVQLRLRRQAEPRLDYPGLRATLSALGGREDDPAAIAAAVTALRRRKLPDPNREPNLGSFFKNPSVPHSQYHHLRRELPRLPGWPQADGTVRIAAAALIEAAGLKGLAGRGCRVSPRHALVIVNDGQAEGRAVLDLARRIREQILVRFGVELEPEPAIVGGSWP